MVHRLSWEEVLLSTLTEPSLMDGGIFDGVFDVSRHLGVKHASSAKKTNHRAGDGGDNQEKHHHGDGPVLIFVIEGRA